MRVSGPSLDRSDVFYNESSTSDHRLDTTIWLSTPNTGTPRNCAPLFLAAQAYKTRHEPFLPPHCNGKKSRGVHSVLRSGVEQRSFAHAVLPIRALLSLLSDVAQQETNIADNTHKTSAVTLTDHVVLRRRRSRLGGANLSMQ